MAVVKKPSKYPSKAFEAELLQHMDSLYLLALRLTQNPVDAQDLLHDAIARALRFHYRFKEGTYFKAWMLTIVRNTFINDYRKKARRPKVVVWDGDDPSPGRPTDVPYRNARHLP